MVTLDTLNCPVCGAPIQDGSARCAYCGSLAVIRMDHPRLDPAMLDRAVVNDRIAALRARVELDSRDAEARYGLGVAYFSLGLLDEAAAELEAAARLTPENPNIHAQLAVVYGELAILGRLGARGMAQDRIARALTLRPDHPEALLLRARDEARTGEWRDALETLRPGLRDDPEVRKGAIDLLLGQATVLAAREEWLAAVPLWREAAAIDPESIRAPLMELLRERQDVLLTRPKWAWVAAPPRMTLEDKARLSAQLAFSALGCFVAFILLAQSPRTEGLSVLFFFATAALPAWLFWRQRRRRREAAALNLQTALAIQRDPAAFFRGEPAPETILRAAEYVASELQGRAIVAREAWLAGGTRPAARGALLRAPWMPRDRDGD